MFGSIEKVFGHPVSFVYQNFSSLCDQDRSAKSRCLHEWVDVGIDFSLKNRGSFGLFFGATVTCYEAYENKEYNSTVMG